MQEVKFLYQNLKLTPDTKGVTIRNESLFEGTGDYELVYSLLHEGQEIARNAIHVDVAAQTEAYIPLTFPSTDKKPGEYVIHTALVLKEATLWAEAGHEVAFGQHIFIVEDPNPLRAPTGGALRVVHGDVNIGVHGADFSIMFSKGAGSLTSLRYAGREMIAMPPAPLFWRATTDNDRGTALGFEAGGWFAASLTRKCVGIEVTEEQTDRVTITFRYT